MSYDNASLLRGITQKDLKKLVRKLCKKGFELESSGSNHIKLYPPPEVDTSDWDTPYLLVGMTVGGGAHKHLRRDLRKRGVRI